MAWQLTTVNIIYTSPIICTISNCDFYSTSHEIFRFILSFTFHHSKEQIRRSSSSPTMTTKMKICKTALNKIFNFYFVFSVCIFSTQKIGLTKPKVWLLPTCNMRTTLLESKFSIKQQQPKQKLYDTMSHFALSLSRKPEKKVQIFEHLFVHAS